MKYTPAEIADYLKAAFNAVHFGHQERLRDHEFSRVCLDLVSADREAKASINAGLTSDSSIARMIHPGYYTALGVVAASTFLPEEGYRKALEDIATLLDSKEGWEGIQDVQIGFKKKAESVGMDAASLEPAFNKPFDRENQGYLIASSYVSLSSRQIAHSSESVMRNADSLAPFLRKIQKTKGRLSDWDQISPLIQIYAGLPPAGGKNRVIQSMIKEMQDDGLKVAIRNSSVNPETRPEELEFSDALSAGLGSFIDAIEGRVPDTTTILSGLLLCKNELESLLLKEQLGDDPLWLPHAVLNQANNPSMLEHKHSTLSVVMEFLLKNASDNEKEAFWNKRPEKVFHMKLAHKSREIDIGYTGYN